MTYESPNKIEPLLRPVGTMSSGISVISDAFDADLIERTLLLMMDALPTIGERVNDEMRTSIDIDFSVFKNQPESSEFHPEALKPAFDIDEMDAGFVAGVGKLIEIYSKSHIYIGEGPWVDCGYQFRKYQRHVGEFALGVDSPPSQGLERVLSIIVFLNDVTVGGRTIFPSQEMSVKAKAGDALVFPAYWTHPYSVQTPTSDDEYVMVTHMQHQTAAARAAAQLLDP